MYSLFYLGKLPIQTRKIRNLRITNTIIFLTYFTATRRIFKKILISLIRMLSEGGPIILYSIIHWGNLYTLFKNVIWNNKPEGIWPMYFMQSLLDLIKWATFKEWAPLPLFLCAFVVNSLLTPYFVI